MENIKALLILEANCLCQIKKDLMKEKYNIKLIKEQIAKYQNTDTELKYDTLQKQIDRKIAQNSEDIKKLKVEQDAYPFTRKSQLTLLYSCLAHINGKLHMNRVKEDENLYALLRVPLKLTYPHKCAANCNAFFRAIDKNFKWILYNNHNVQHNGTYYEEHAPVKYFPGGTTVFKWNLKCQQFLVKEFIKRYEQGRQ